MTATTTQTARSGVDRRAHDRRNPSDVALELADLQMRLTVLAAQAGESSAMFVGTDDFTRHSGRLEAFTEAVQLVSNRIAELTKPERVDVSVGGAS